jgi:hypothetical protein
MAYRQAWKGPVRRRDDDGDARLADLEPADPVVNRDERAWPVPVDFAFDPLEDLHRQRAVRLVFQVPDAPTLMHRADRADKRAQRAAPFAAIARRGFECRHEPLDGQRLAHDRQPVFGHRMSIAKGPFSGSP